MGCFVVLWRLVQGASYLVWLIDFSTGETKAKSKGDENCFTCSGHSEESRLFVKCSSVVVGVSVFPIQMAKHSKHIIPGSAQYMLIGGNDYAKVLSTKCFHCHDAYFHLLIKNLQEVH